METIDRLTHETTELLQQLIRNRCVNDGTRDSGHESRNADALGGVLNIITRPSLSRRLPSSVLTYP